MCRTTSFCIQTVNTWNGELFDTGGINSRAGLVYLIHRHTDDIGAVLTNHTRVGFYPKFEGYFALS
jgi:hypothetical protein